MGARLYLTVKIKLNKNVAVLNKMFKMRIKHGWSNESLLFNRQKNKWTDEGGIKAHNNSSYCAHHSVSGPMVIGEST